jgi:hypothetical protein
MNLPPPNEEEQIRSLLSGDDTQIELGLNRLDDHYREKICGMLRCLFSKMPARDLPLVWQDTLFSLHQMVLRGTYDPSCELLNEVARIATRCGRDRLRRHAKLHLPIDSLMRETDDGPVNESWHALTAAQRSEVVDLICRTVSGLLPLERLVWRVYAQGYPEYEEFEELAEAVRRSACNASCETQADDSWHAVPDAAVRSALLTGRAKIRANLKQKGYDL